MRRSLRSRPFVAVVLALQLAFVGAPACAMASSGHAHPVAPADTRANDGPVHDEHSHHGAPLGDATPSVGDALVDDADQRTGDSHSTGDACAAAMTCGVASLASLSPGIPEPPSRPARHVPAPSLTLTSIVFEPEAPPPRA